MTQECNATNLKLCLFEQLALIGKSLGHANRLMILDILAQTPSSVENLSQKLKLTNANVSKHLQQLRQNGLVNVSIDGNQRIYRLSDPAITPLIQSMRELAKNQLDEVKHILNKKLQPRAPLIPYNPKQLRTAINKKEVTILDVRPEDEYSAGHIDGAINIPIDKLNQEIHAFSSAKPIVVYCRGPYCLWSYEAVDKLQENGVNAKRLDQGYPDWQQQQN